MEQLIEAFGIDYRLIFLQIFNFGLLLVVLTYFLYKPILNLLNEREAKIVKGIKDAEEAEKMRTLAEEERNNIIRVANNEAQDIVARAKEHAREKADEITASADVRAEQIVNDAMARGEELKTKAVREAEAEISQLSILMAEKVLKERSS